MAAYLPVWHRPTARESGPSGLRHPLDDAVVDPDFGGYSVQGIAVLRGGEDRLDGLEGGWRVTLAATSSAASCVVGLGALQLAADRSAGASAAWFGVALAPPVRRQISG